MENLLQRSRFELKYVVSEARAREIRSFARNHLVSDPFADPSRGNAYPIYSVYLDSPRRDLMNQTLDGLKNRFKLRVRFYDEHPGHPVFFEIKRRVGDAIIKQRAKVRRDAAARLLDGGWPDCGDLQNPADARAFASLTKFCELRDRLGAECHTLVHYTREAWCCAENDSVRLTFDRDLQGWSYERTLGTRPGPDLARPHVPGVVLELKFTDRFPVWMRELAQTFDLRRCSMAKYVTCALTLAPRGRAHREQVDAARELAGARAWEERRPQQGRPADAARAPAVGRLDAPAAGWAAVRPGIVT